MKIDLRKDYKAISKHVAQRVRDYDKYVNIGPGEDEDPVSQITLGYQFDQAGWVALVFDTRPNAGREGEDGEWQKYINETAQDFHHWFEAIDPLLQAYVDEVECEPLVIILHTGTKVTVESYDDEEIAKHIGEMLWQVLVDARESGLFARLPLAKQCLMGVSEHDGNYGWPIYKDRIKLGRVN